MCLLLLRPGLNPRSESNPLQGNIEPTLPVELAIKGFSYRLEALPENHVDVPLHRLMNPQYQLAVEQGIGRLNPSGICSL
ncbi:MAG: hypothetical protein H6510_05830 [Acidobacteria bacterium]|nr:hypothetical protein [Acidobacteriota bacterium]MCB9397313.1 hypothetical protein [Acidobacteriota bacterium]